MAAGIARMNGSRKGGQEATARHLDAETSLAPVASLGVVSENEVSPADFPISSHPNYPKDDESP